VSSALSAMHSCISDEPHSSSSRRVSIRRPTHFDRRIVLRVPRGPRLGNLIEILNRVENWRPDDEMIALASVLRDEKRPIVLKSDVSSSPSRRAHPIRARLDNRQSETIAVSVGPPMIHPAHPYTLTSLVPASVHLTKVLLAGAARRDAPSVLDSIADQISSRTADVCTSR
jgi:hypothetical protein